MNRSSYFLPVVCLPLLACTPSTDKEASDTQESAQNSETESTDSGETDSSDETGGSGHPNINMDLVIDRIAISIVTQTLEFPPDSCPVVEGCLDDAGVRRVLRFDTATPNVGTGDLVVGRPEDNPEDFEFGACHEHYHFRDFAEYKLLTTEGETVRDGHKQAFALVDYEALSLESPPAKFPLPDGTQGITRGWSDVYDAYLDCQWVDITDVEFGDYMLQIDVNPMMVFEESSYEDNTILIPVTIDETDDLPAPLPPEWTCGQASWDTDDGCDCGCGAVDPDCPNPTAEACDSCTLPGSCAEGQGCEAIMSGNNAICS